MMHPPVQIQNSVRGMQMLPQNTGYFGGGGGGNVGFQPSFGFPAAKFQSPLHTSWKNDNFPPNELNADNILDYFSDLQNPFYDKSSNNQQIRQQNINRPLGEILLSTTGIQFVLLTARPPLFVILKQYRKSPNEVTPLIYYHVVNGSIYQSPDVYSIVQSRLTSCLTSLRAAFNETKDYVRYNVAKGYYWNFDRSPANQERNRKEAEGEDDETFCERKPEEVRSTLYQRTRGDRLLALLTEKFPPPDDQQQKPEQLSPIEEISAGAQSSSVPLIGSKRLQADSIPYPQTKRLKIDSYDKA